MDDRRLKINNHWFGKTLASILLLLLVLGCDSPEEKEAKFYQRGLALYEQGDDTKAMLEFRNVLRLNPKNADALYHVGLIHERADRLPQAYAAFQAAVAERPDFASAQFHYGTLALRAGEIAIADKAAETIERADAANPDGLALRSAVMLRQGDFQRAKDLAEEVVAKSPGNPVAIGVVVGVLRQRGRVDEAIAYLDRMLAASPNDMQSRLLRINLLEEAGRTDALPGAYADLLTLAPDNPDYRLALANSLQRRGDLAAAETAVREILARGLKSDKTLPALMDLIQRQRGIDAVKAEYAAMIAAQPDNASLRLALADLHSQLGELTDAERILAAAMEQFAGQPVADDAQARIAATKLAAGDKQAAARIADEVLQRDSGHRQANLVKGQIALDEKHLDDALRDARSSLRDDPEWLPGLRLLASTYLGRQEADLATETFATIVRLDPADMASAGQLTRLLARRGDYDGAVKVLDQVAGATSDPTPALLARASLSVRQRNWLAAQTDLERLRQMPGQEAAVALLGGTMLFAQGDFAHARQAFEEAAARQPESWEAVVGAVQSYLELNDVAGALAYLERLRAARPDDALAYGLTGEVLAQQGDLSQAEAALQQAIRLRPAWSTPYRQLAALRARAGDAKGAAAIQATEAAQRPEDPNVLMRLALAQMNAGEFDAAIMSYAAVLAKVPDDEVALNNYAALIADHRLDRPEELKDALGRAQRFRASDDPALLDTLGWLQYRNGDYLGAVATLDRALMLQPDRAASRARLGMALYRSGQQERAAVELARALADPAAAAVDPEVGPTYSQLQDDLHSKPKAINGAP